ncbi:MAG: hypothetical protein RSB35_03395 [Eubacterium sp.]
MDNNEYMEYFMNRVNYAMSKYGLCRNEAIEVVKVCTVQEVVYDAVFDSDGDNLLEMIAKEIRDKQV